MSSLSRGASSAGRPRPVNVNSLYSGRNPSSVTKSLGKYGIATVGKSIGVVRRMPPPATLPSLKSENNGQDPNSVVLPLGNVGWSRSEPSMDSLDVFKALSSSPTALPDLRPTWAKQSQDSVNCGSGKGEFPTLSTSAQRPSTSRKTRRKSVTVDLSLPSGSRKSADKLPDELSSGHDTTAEFGNTPEQQYQSMQNPRFRSFPEETSFSPMEGNEGLPSSPRMCGRSGLLNVSLHCDLNRYGESPKDQFDRNKVIDKSRCKRTNFQSTDREEVDKESRLHEETAKQLSSNVAITGSERSQSLGRSEDEEDIQMTKLDKLAVRVVKRVAETNELSADEGRNSIALVSLHDAHAKLAAKGHNLQAEMTTDADGSVQREQPDNNSDSVESVGHSGYETCITIPTLTQNVWTKRRAERASQEKESDAGQLPSDSGFKRVALHSERQQDSNDIRQLSPSKTRSNQRQSSLREQPEGAQWYDSTCSGQTRLDCEECNSIGQRWTRNIRSNCRRSLGSISVSTSAENHRTSGGRFVRSDSLLEGAGTFHTIATRVKSSGSCCRDGVQLQMLHRWSCGTTAAEDEATLVADAEKLPSASTAEGNFYEEGKRCIVGGNSNIIGLRRRHDDDRKHQKNTLHEGGDASQNQNKEEGRRTCRPFSNCGKAIQNPYASRWHFRVTCSRGHARRGRGGLQHRRFDHSEACMQRATIMFDSIREDAERVGHVKHARGKNSYQQQRNRRKCGQNSKNSAKRNGQERSGQLRSPAVSSEGYDEWETASESSTRILRGDHSEVRACFENPRCMATTPSRKCSDYRIATAASVFASQTEHPKTRSAAMERPNGLGYVQSAGCMLPSPLGNFNIGSKMRSNRRSRHIYESEKDVSDGLMGLNINDVANVVVIDDRSVDAASVGKNDELEQVLNKRVKKQKAHMMQAKVDAEEKRASEMECQIHIQAKKRTRSNNMRKDKRDDNRRKSEKNAGCWSKSMEQNKSQKQFKENTQQFQASERAPGFDITACVEERREDTRKNVPVTTIWNSAHVAEQKELLEEMEPVIPSPIARPTPGSISVASCSPSTYHDLVRRQVVELPVSLSSSHPICAEKYDFTFDPRLHEEQVSNEKVLTSLSTGNDSEAGSMADDLRLKENLYKVKGLWCEEENETGSVLPPNVAKVRPQPQSDAGRPQNDYKATVSVPTPSHVFSPRNSGIAQFPSGLSGLMFSPYPIMFGDISLGRGYASIRSVVRPLIPPSNASSPPLCPHLYQQPASLTNNRTMSQPRLPIRSSYFDRGAVFASNMTQSQSVGWTVGSMSDVKSNVPAIPSQQLPSAENHPQATSHGYDASVRNTPPNGTHIHPPHAGTISSALVSPLHIPPQDLINIPAPVGTQRLAPFTVQYAGFAPSPLTNPLHSSHNFNQPLPSGRFAKPPPPLHQDAHWDRAISFSGVQHHISLFPGKKRALNQSLKETCSSDFPREGHTTMEMNAVQPNQQSNIWPVNTVNTSPSHLLQPSQIRTLEMMVERRPNCRK